MPHLYIAPIQPLDLAEQQVSTWRKSGGKVVFTNGCFDIIHLGHSSYLAQAKALGDRLVVGINSDSSVRALKGPHRPIQTEIERAGIIASLKSVDLVIIFDELTPVSTITCLKPDIHVKGGDYVIADLPETAIVQVYGGQVQILPFIDGCSTTGIIDRIVQRYGTV